MIRKQTESGKGMLRFSPNPNLAHLVHWAEWEESAFRKARAEDKPVMLFLSAFWCGYCQRMDEGALSDRENRALLNAYFSPLRVENAMRPDIDSRYNLNGWPTVAFFSPGGALLAAANYLPPQEFQDLLLNVYLAYQGHAAGERAQPAHRAPGDDAAEGARDDQARLREIAQAVMAQADRAHGGFGSGQKFIQPAANGFLLALYEATGQPEYLGEACRTLDGMRAGEIHDAAGGGFFRTTSGADWTQPHREKLLHEHAGLLDNYLHAHRLTGRAGYRDTAEEIIAYLERRLFDGERGAFLGCEDFLRREPAEQGANEFFTIVDPCVYADANAQAARAYLEAASLLGRADCRVRALGLVDFLWRECRTEEAGVFHYHDGAPRLPGLLEDQVQLGLALVEAHRASGEAIHLERARTCADFIGARLTNAAGGYFDCAGGEPALRKAPLTDVEQNGAAASFFWRLGRATGQARYFEAARWALAARPDTGAAGGIHMARFGSALLECLGV